MKVSFKRRSKFKVVLTHYESTVKLLVTSFTILEISALRKSWPMIEPKRKMLSQKIALDAYTENPEWAELFRFDGKTENNSLIYHPLCALDIYGTTIKTNLDTNYAIVKIILLILEKHWNRFIPMPYLKVKHCGRLCMYIFLQDFLECVKHQVLEELHLRMGH
ncbi:uncharacterized protein LOC118754220 [Rhagoletis pomonella]|uniref:uncharacterized protein LOC118754220 n=1 Tax=Rhagoletis pomonella TaxID=28610 RepID=UPI001783C601|nr:uncharacterized protein LOC118754220 [Rhagoletis pomonella]